MPTFAAQTLTYHYRVADGNDTLLLLHGFTGSAQNWSWLETSIAGKQGIVAIDLPGHGLSDAPSDPSSYAMPTVARDVVALLDHQDLERAHLLGYSMGGRLALYLALHYPDRWRSLVLESASPGLASRRERAARVAQDEALANFIEEQGIEAFVGYWENLPLFASQRRLPPAVREAHRAARLRNRTEGLSNSLRGMGTGVQPSLWPRLQQIAMPTLLIVGGMDEKFVSIARQMGALMPEVDLQIIPDAGHTVHLEQPEQFAALITAWLARQT